MITESFLKIENLHFSYGGARILRGVSLELLKGDVVCIIGPNGAGKTTILRTITGLERPTSGQILFNGNRMDGFSLKKILRAGISLVPEQGRLFPDMTVFENLMMGAYLRNDRKNIMKDLDVVYRYFPRLGARTRQRAGSLSGGERQMAAVGRALMSGPKVLLMDEPSSGLAPQLVSMVGQIVLDINKHGISVLLVEQNADMALNVSRYGYALEQGRVSLEGEATELISHPMIKKTYLGI
jgi:branched-chain amino acid transport system ATP-binding protein